MKFRNSMLWCNCELILYFMELCTNVLVNGIGYDENFVLMWLWVYIRYDETMNVDCMGMVNVWNGMRLCMRNLMK